MNTYRKTKSGQWSLTEDALQKRYTAEVSVTAKEIENIIVDALEAQSNYWCGLDNTGPEWAEKPAGMPASQFAVQRILEGHSIILYDIECEDFEDEDETWALKLEMLLEGIGLAISYGFEIENDVDVVLQYALFGDLVYG